MVALLRDNARFRRLWIAGVVSWCGSWLLVIAVPVQVYRLTGSPATTGLVLAVESLPAVVLAPWAGVIIDRWDRRRTLVLANLAAAGGVALIALGASPGRIGLIYAGVLAENTCAALMVPAMRAITPSLVTGEAELATANTLNAVAGALLRLAGPLAGTYLVAAGHFGAVVAADAVSYVAAAVLVAGVGVPAVTGAGGRVRISGGLRHIARTPLLCGMLATSWLFLAANGALTALLVPVAAAHLGDGGRVVGYLVAGLGAGYVCGSALAKALIARYATRPVLTAAYATVGVCFLVLFTATSLLVALAAITLCGVPGAVILVVVGHRMQTATPDGLLGRVGAAFAASDATATLTGAILAPVMVTVAGLDAAATGFSAAVVITAAAAFVLLRTTATPVYTDTGVAADGAA